MKRWQSDGMLLRLKPLCLKVGIRPPTLSINNRPHPLELRRVKDLKPVLADQRALKNSGAVVYAIARGITLPVHKQLFSRFRVRCDLTIILPTRLGDELPKTFGHFHKGKYVEVYEVLHGSVHIVLQKRGVQIFEAGAGDKVLIPPSHAHCTINVGKGTAVIANLVASDCVNDYEQIATKHGLAIYEFRHRLVQNPNWPRIATHRVRAHQQRIPALLKQSLYTAFVNNPRRVAALLRSKAALKQL